MIEKIKNIGYGTLGICILVLVFVAPILFIIGSVKLFEALYPALEIISVITWTIVWLLLLFSIVPRFRELTGNGIILGTYIGGAIFWLLCFYITFSLWGFLGILIGVLFFGLGVFITAILALVFDGQFMEALNFAFILIQIFALRFAGFWIIEKHKEPSNNHNTNNKEDNTYLEESNTNHLDEGLYDPEMDEYVKDDDEPQSNYCASCGNKLDSDSNFCSGCGEKI